jgi:hypothetical protein
MKFRLFNRKSVTALFLFSHFVTNFVSGQNHVQKLHLQQDQIISQSLTHESLYEQSEIDINSIGSFYVLNHGVDLNFSSDLKINDTPVVIIGKSDISILNNEPYFLFHTLDIQDAKAFVRVYLTYTKNGETNTFNEDIPFIRTNGQWQIGSNH